VGEGDQEQFDSQLEAGMKRTLVLMMMADGEIDENEVSAIQRVYRHWMDVDLSEDDIRTEAVAALSDTRGIAEHLNALVGRINSDGKEAIVSAAFMIAAMDGHVAESELDFLAQVGAALEMEAGEVQGIIEGLLAE